MNHIFRPIAIVLISCLITDSTHATFLEPGVPTKHITLNPLPRLTEEALSLRNLSSHLLGPYQPETDIGAKLKDYRITRLERHELPIIPVAGLTMRPDSSDTQPPELRGLTPDDGKIDRVLAEIAYDIEKGFPIERLSDTECDLLRGYLRGGNYYGNDFHDPVLFVLKRIAADHDVKLDKNRFAMVRLGLMASYWIVRMDELHAGHYYEIVNSWEFLHAFAEAHKNGGFTKPRPPIMDRLSMDNSDLGQFPIRTIADAVSTILKNNALYQVPGLEVTVSREDLKRKGLSLSLTIKNTNSGRTMDFSVSLSKHYGRDDPPHFYVSAGSIENRSLVQRTTLVKDGIKNAFNDLTETTSWKEFVNPPDSSGIPPGPSTPILPMFIGLLSVGSGWVPWPFYLLLVSLSISSLILWASINKAPPSNEAPPPLWYFAFITAIIMLLSGAVHLLFDMTNLLQFSGLLMVWAGSLGIVMSFLRILQLTIDLDYYGADWFGHFIIGIRVLAASTSFLSLIAGVVDVINYFTPFENRIGSIFVIASTILVGVLPLFVDRSVHPLNPSLSAA